MVGKTVKCPKCQKAFAFEPPKPVRRENRAVTDTGVMRILGEMPKMASSTESIHEDQRSVTDTGVMRILGEIPELPPAAKNSSEVAKRPCSRCSAPIPESSAICPHCSCYVGLMPTFLQQMTEPSDISRN